MGVSIDVWRARIGSFHCSCGSGFLACSFSVSSSIRGCLSLVFFTIFYLLVIGNVELNPGPQTYRCDVCTKEFGSLLKVSEHLRIHAVSKNFSFMCAGPTCHRTFTTFKGLKEHLQAFHSGSLASEAEISISPCQDAFNKVKAGGSVTCPLRDVCESDVVYNGAESNTALSRLQIHLARYHPGWKQKEGRHSELLEDVEGVDVTASDINFNPGLSPSVSFSAGSRTPSPSDEPAYDMDSVVDFIAHFYLKLETQFNLPANTVNLISQSIADLSEMLLERTQHVVGSQLKAHGISHEIFVDVQNFIRLNDALYCAHHREAPGPTLTSDHLREKYAVEKFFLTYPCEVSIDNDPFSGNTVHHVSIRQTLQLLFQDPTVCKLIDESFVRLKHQNDDSVLRDFSDGLIFQGSLESMEDTIFLILFQDAFNLANPLGSVKNFYKFLGVYFTLGNFPPHIRCKLDGMFLTLLANCNLISEEGLTYGQILSPVLKELNSLTTHGVNYNGRMIKFKLQFVAGDSLGSHGIGGFVESFSANYFCRYCEVLKSSFKDDPLAVGITRTERNYNAACSRLELQRAAGVNVNNIKGIKSKSPFNAIPNFHVCKPALPPCLGHDLFEGVVSWDVAEILFKLVDKNWFTYKELQRRIRRFQYLGRDCNNKPSRAVRDSESLRGHAIQNWTLLRLLPFILEGKVKDPSNEFWQLYLKLKLIVEYVCAPQLHTDTITEMENLIEEYLSERQQVLSTLRPKHHYLRHYAWLYKVFGPMIYLWTMRFEAKHKFFKRIARTCNNFINLGYLLAHRHQLYMSYLFSGPFFKSGLLNPKCIGKKEKKILEEVNVQSFIAQDPSLVQTNFLCSVQIGDIKYKVGNYVLIKAVGEAIKVGKLKAIGMWVRNVKFIVEVYYAKFWKEYGLYRLPANAICCESVLQSELLYPMPHSVYEFSDFFCLSLKHQLM